MTSPKIWKTSYDINRKYNSNWEEIFSWVEKDPEESEAAYCKICHCVIVQKLSSLVAHDKTTKHKKKCRSVFGQHVLKSTTAKSNFSRIDNEDLNGNGKIGSCRSISESEYHSPPPDDGMEEEEEEYDDCQTKAIPQTVVQKSKSSRRKRPFSSISTVDKKKEGADNEFDFFGKSLAIQLNKMPLDRALACQEKLQKVMTEERMFQIRNKATPSSAPVKISFPKSFFCLSQPLSSNITSTPNLKTDQPNEVNTTINSLDT